MAEFKIYNHSLTHFQFMKKAFISLMLLALSFGCTPENNSENGSTKNDPDELVVTGDVLDVTDYSATFTGYANLPFESGDAEVGIMYDENNSFKAAKKIVAAKLDGNNKFTVTATDLESSTTYYYKSYVKDGAAMQYGAIKSFITKESKCPKSAVDLGIVMTRSDGTSYKLYWAECNLGAEKPEDRGDYYAWGETEPKTDYSWSTYKWGKSSTTLTKYNTLSFRGTVDNNTVLDPEDDVAHVKLGGNWRMPTDEEWTELRMRCTWIWTTQNGVLGSKVYCNGKSIFIPATGTWKGTSLKYVDNEGHYWSSSLNASYPYCAFNICNVPGAVGKSGEYERYYGQSVRPVSE